VWAGGSTYITASAAGDVAFTVKMTNIPKAGCISLLTTVAGTNRDTGLVGVGATTTSNPIASLSNSATTAISPGATQVAAVTPAIATAACSDPSANIVGFSFSIK